MACGRRDFDSCLPLTMAINDIVEQYIHKLIRSNELSLRTAR